MELKLERIRPPLLLALGGAWLAFQAFLLAYPRPPLLERPIHLSFALAVVFLSRRPDGTGNMTGLAHLIDAALALAALAGAIYYLVEGPRLSDRMEGIDKVLAVDRVFGLLLLFIVLEGVRRTVGWMLLSVILLFLAFGFIGRILPGWIDLPWVPELFRYEGFTLDDALDSFTMTSNGVLGLTTSTSVNLVFYFVAFGAFYSAIGGGRFLIDIGLGFAGRQRGGVAKAAVISSSLMGSLSGSAVANVATTGVFTIPMMRRTGYKDYQAAGIEAIASTGGQLMPPIMGVAAFVMAELLQIPYHRVALAGVVPAMAFYLSVFLVVDLNARRLRVEPPENKGPPKLRGRLYLLIPPAVLIGLLLSGKSAPYAAAAATVSCLVTAYLRRASWLGVRDWMAAVRGASLQAAQVAVPIAAIGLIIEVAIQSNLALKFSAGLMSMGHGFTPAILLLIILGCLVMGLGLPTVAAYIIGSILFVPSLIGMGLNEVAAHFFVMYYCVLSMITPPVALASFTAAGLAGANSFRTSLEAFRLGLVAFFVPFIFVFDPAFLGLGSPARLGLLALVVALAILAWAAAVEGFLKDTLRWRQRLLLGTASIAVFATPALLHTLSQETSIGAARSSASVWTLSVSLLLLALAGSFFVTPRRNRSRRGTDESRPAGPT